jgi:hypothetical protein
MNRYSGKQYWNKKRADEILYILKEANYNINNVDNIIKQKINEMENLAKQIENMTYEQFEQMVSKSLFGVMSKDYYIEKLRKQKESLQNIKQAIIYLMENYNKEHWDWIVKNSYSGKIREIKQAIGKLIQNSEVKTL